MSSVPEEPVQAFVPRPLPPAKPPMLVDGELARLHSVALTPFTELDVARVPVSNPDWFLYVCAREESVSQLSA